MNILFFEKDEELKLLLKYLDTTIGINLFLYKNCEECSNIYENQDIDIVIINFTLEFGKESLNYILEKNPKQKIITISDALECSEANGGDYCQTHYNKIRLLKPINTSELVRYIKYFESNTCRFCDNFNSSSGLVNIIGDIIRRFRNAKYNKEMKTIDIDYSHNMIDIIQFLNNKNINFSIISNTSIQINQ